MVDGKQPRQDRRALVEARSFESAIAKSAPEALVFEHLPHHRGDLIRVLWIDENRGIPRHLGERGPVRGNDGCATGHGLHHREPESFGQGGKDKDPRPAIHGREFERREIPHIDDRTGTAHRIESAPDLCLKPPVRRHDHQLVGLPELFGLSQVEDGFAEAVLITKGEKPTFAALQTDEWLEPADRIVDIVDLGTDPETGMTLYGGWLEY